MNSADAKIVEPGDLERRLDGLQRPIVFTNGCFDILHRGHVAYLESARALGKSMVVGVNSDASMGKLGKGPGRPVNSLDDRMAVLAALESVDLVVSFDEETPLALIKLVHPDHLVKGGDWEVGSIVGGDVVKSWGGQVHSVPIRFERSTSAVIERIRS